MYCLLEADFLANTLYTQETPIKVRLLWSWPHFWPFQTWNLTSVVQRTLTVDNFGVNYICKQHAEHLLGAFSHHYKMEEDWKGEVYFGIKLSWNYTEGYIDISMPNYVKKKNLPNTAITHPYAHNIAQISQSSTAIIQRKLYTKLNLLPSKKRAKIRTTGSG